jgi:tripartite-type tricarboxylate transporter receptor subunit TctC
LRRLETEIALAMVSPDMKEFAEGMGAEPRQVNAAAFAKIVQDSTVMWGKIAANTSFDKQ